MTPERIAEAQARLDAIPRERDEHLRRCFTEPGIQPSLDVARFVTPAQAAFLEYGPTDLAAALAALRRVRDVAQRYDDLAERQERDAEHEEYRTPSASRRSALRQAAQRNRNLARELRAALDGEPG